MWLEDCIRELKGKKELRGLDDEFVRNRIADYLRKEGVHFSGEYGCIKKTKPFKLMFKLLRKQLRDVYGVFQQVRESRSRLVYERILRESGSSILDIGCGEAPFEYCLLYPEKTYYLCDIDAALVAKLQGCMRKNKLKGKAFVFSPLDDTLDKLPTVDTVLLLRTLESFEALERDISKRLLKQLQCRKIVVSFAKVALGRKIKIRKSGRAWFRRMLEEPGYSYTIEDIDKEIFFFIDKGY